MVRATGAKNARHYLAATPKIQAYRDRWVELAPFRDGPVNPQRFEVNDPAEMTKQIKVKATDLGADMVGVCRLQPHMIDLGAGRAARVCDAIPIRACATNTAICASMCARTNVKSHPGTYKAFMKERKQVGYKTPKSW